MSELEDLLMEAIQYETQGKKSEINEEHAISHGTT